jgi:hypothetical protein
MKVVRVFGLHNSSSGTLTSAMGHTNSCYSHASANNDQLVSLKMTVPVDCQVHACHCTQSCIVIRNSNAFASSLHRDIACSPANPTTIHCRMHTHAAVTENKVTCWMFTHHMNQTDHPMNQATSDAGFLKTMAKCQALPGFLIVPTRLPHIMYGSSLAGRPLHRTAAGVLVRHALSATGSARHSALHSSYL